MTPLLRSLIRETLLLEEVYGAQATVYHGTEANPVALISALLKDEFTPGVGAGEMYGKGLYTVYDLPGTKTERGDYGPHVIKLKVNLYGYIIFDPDIALMVYKKSLTPKEQAAEFGYSETVIKALGSVASPRRGIFTSVSAESVHKSLQYEVKGLVFTGQNDGKVVVVYDPTTAVPMAWKRVTRHGDPVSEPWTPVDRASLLKPLDRPDVSAREGRPVQQSTLRRSAMGDFEAGKWDNSPLTILKRLERLPKDQRVVNGDLDLMVTPVTSLPSGLKVGGSLNLFRTSITTLPADLQVGGSLNLSYTPITSLPAGLKVSGSLNLRNTPITSLPAGLKVGGDLDLIHCSVASFPDDLEVGGSLYLPYTSITSLPVGLKVGESLNLRNTRITSLPAGLEVRRNLYLSDSPITALPADLKVGESLNLSNSSVTSLPADLELRGNLDLYRTRITSLPAGLQVGGYLNIRGTPITSLPADLQVGASGIYGLDRKHWADVPEHLKSKLK